MAFWGDVNDGLTELPILGPLFGQTPEQSASQADKQKAMNEVAKSYQDAIPDVQGRRQAQLAQTLAYFQPMNAQLAKMYGPGAVDTGPRYDTSIFDKPAPGPQAALTPDDLTRIFQHFHRGSPTAQPSPAPSPTSNGWNGGGRAPNAGFAGGGRR